MEGLAPLSNTLTAHGRVFVVATLLVSSFVEQPSYKGGLACTVDIKDCWRFLSERWVNGRTGLGAVRGRGWPGPVAEQWQWANHSSVDVPDRRAGLGTCVSMGDKGAREWTVWPERARGNQVVLHPLLISCYFSLFGNHAAFTSFTSIVLNLNGYVARTFSRLA